MGTEADHSPPSCARVKNVWSYASASPYPLMDDTVLRIETTLSLFHVFEFVKKFQD
jgi:hypothetical protein